MPILHKWHRQKLNVTEEKKYTGSSKPQDSDVQPLPDLHKGCVMQNFTQDKFYLSWNFPKFNSIQFNFLILSAGKITKVCFEMYNKKIKTSASTTANIL